MSRVESDRDDNDRATPARSVRVHRETGSGNGLAGMRITLLLLVASLLATPTGSRAAEIKRELPFDPAVINRHSVDGVPRSLSIRHGAGVWMAYDLERAVIFKVWQAPAGKPGLITSGFTTRPAGTTLFGDASDGTWQLWRAGQPVALKIRHLGCSQRDDHFVLSWELRHDSGACVLHERIPFAALPAGGRVTRELRVESLPAGATLLPPTAGRERWKLSNQQGTSVPSITNTERHRLTLP